MEARGRQKLASSPAIAARIRCGAGACSCRAEFDPGRSLQEAMVSAMEVQSRSSPTALSVEQISDHFAELAAALDNDPFAIYAELASTAAAFPAEHPPAILPRRERRRRMWMTVFFTHLVNQFRAWE